MSVNNTLLFISALLTLLLVLVYARANSICDGISSTDSRVCSGHGQCLLVDTCDCDDNFYGVFCGIECSGDFAVTINDGQPAMPMKIDDSFRLDSMVRIPECVNTSIASIKYAWSGPGSLSSNDSFLQIREFIFPNVDAEVTVLLEVKFYDGDKTLVASKSASILLDINPIYPKAFIDGGILRLVKVGDSIVLDGTQSSVYKGATRACTWRCAGSCGVFQNASSCLTTLSTSISGVSAISLEVSDGIQSDTATAAITSSPTVITYPAINLPTIQCLRSFERNRAKAQVYGYISTDVQYKWRLFTSASVEITLDKSNLLSRPEGLKDITFKEDTLVPGETYRLRFEVTSGGVPAYAQVNLQVCPSAAGGFFKVAPNNGTSLRTMFEFVAENYTAPLTSRPLSYAFQFKYGKNGRWNWLSSFSPKRGLRTLLPPGGGVANRLDVRVAVRTRYGQITYSNPIPVYSAPIERDDLFMYLNRTGTLLDTIQNQEFIESTVALLSAVINNYNATTDEERTLLYSVNAKLVNVMSNRVSGGSMDTKSGLPAMDLVFSGSLTSESKRSGFDLMNELLQNGGLDFESVTETVNPIASLIRSTKGEKDLRERSFELIQTLGSSLLSRMGTGEDPVLIVEDTFCMCTSADVVENLQNVYQPGLLHSSLIFNFADHEPLQGLERVGVVFSSTFEMNPYLNNATLDVASPLIAFKVVDESGNQIEIKNLTTPLILDLTLLNSSTTLDAESGSNYTIVCMYWDESNSSQTQWETDGCYLEAVSDGVATCRCDHTTTFAAFIQYDEINNSKLDVALYGASIAIHSTIVATSIPLLILTFLLRLHQPMKSRFLSPYIGLSAVIVESLIQGIIRSSMLIAGTSTVSINWIGNAVLVFTVPLSLLAWFVYFWQHLRFCFLQHMHEAMKKNKNTVVLVFRILTSRPLYIFICGAVYALSFAYFTLFTGLRQGEVINALDGTTITTTSYSGMSLVFAVLIGLCVLYDAANTLRIHKQGKDMEVGKSKFSAKELLKLVKNFFGKADPLKFRSEAVLMFITVACAAVSYISGLVVVRETSSDYDPVKIVQFVFDILYLFSRISTFGGFACFTTVRQYIKMGGKILQIVRRNKKDYASEIEDMLSDEKGFEVFLDYSASEFATENVFAWSAVNKLREDMESGDENAVASSCKYFASTYVRTNSPRELNLPNKSKSSFIRVSEQLDQGQANKQEISEVVDALSANILANLSDTFSRMVCSEAYANYKLHRDMSQELKQSANM